MVDGAEQLAQIMIAAARQESRFNHLYDLDWPIKKKIETIATRMYGASGVSFTQEVEGQIKTASRLGYDRLPICMAKTPLSLSHDPSLKGRPTGFILPIQELRMLAGAGFLTAGLFGNAIIAGPAKETCGRTDGSGCGDRRDRRLSIMSPLLQKAEEFRIRTHDQRGLISKCFLVSFHRAGKVEEMRVLTIGFRVNPKGFGVPASP